MLTLNEFERFAGQVRAEYGRDLPTSASDGVSTAKDISPDFVLEFLPDGEPDILAQFSGTFDNIALGAYLFDSGELLLILLRPATTDCLTWSSVSGSTVVGQGAALSPLLRRLFRCLVRASYTGQHRAGTFSRPQ